MFAVVLTGPPGSGKTVALTALLDALAGDEIPHAGVDVDEVSWAFPFPDLAQRCEHLRAWRQSHVRAGATLLVVAEVIESWARSQRIEFSAPPTAAVLMAFVLVLAAVAVCGVGGVVGRGDRSKVRCHTRTSRATTLVASARNQSCR